MAPRLYGKLAIEGGAPVRSSLLPYGRHHVTANDIAAVAAVLRSDRLTTGPTGEQFEREFASRVGNRFAVSFSSGTSALHGAAFAAGVGVDDEAIVTPLTFCATANAIVYQRGCPVFADVDRNTLTLSPESVERAITPKTKAIFTVAFGGHPSACERLREIAHERGLLLIEDAAHALGAQVRGQPIGPRADLTTFSFHPVKHIAGGEGGMVTTDCQELAERLRRFRNHGLTRDARERADAMQWQYDLVELGYNYRLSDLAAALAFSQLDRLDANLERRREIVTRYREAFAHRPEFELPSEAPGYESAWHLYAVQVQPEFLTTDRDGIFEALRAENIGVNVHYPLVPELTFYRENFGPFPRFPVAEDAAPRLLTLPLFPAMSEPDIDDVITAVHKVLDGYSRG